MNMFQQYPQARDAEFMRRKRMMEDEDAIMRQRQIDMMYGQGAGQFEGQMQDPFINRNLGSTNRITNPVSANYPPQGLLYDQPNQDMAQQGMASYAQNPMMAEPTKPSVFEDPQAGFAMQQRADAIRLANQQEAFQDREILAEYEAADAANADPSMSQSEIQGYGNVAMKALQGLQQNDQPPKMMKAPGLLQPNAAFLSSYRPPAQMRQIPRYNLLG